MSEFMKLAIVFISMLVCFIFYGSNGYMIFERKTSLIICCFTSEGKNKCEVSFHLVADM